MLLPESFIDGSTERGVIRARPRIAVVAQGSRQAEQLVDYMNSHALEGFITSSMSAAKDADLTAQFDAVVLDIGAEAEDPLDFIRYFAGLQAAPGIIVYSTIENEVDRVVALEVGADDVIPKSCGFRELVARIRAVLRRRRADLTHPSDTGTSVSTGYGFAGWSIDLPAKTLTTPEGQVVLLSRLEFMIMSTLFQKPAVVHSRAELARLIGHADKGEALRAINVLIGSIRKKITADGSADIIVNRRGIGYHLSALGVAL